VSAAMTADEIRQVVTESLSRVAPEINSASVRPGVNFREEFDLDSMDFLNFVVALHERLGIDIPEADYPRLYTLDEAVAYLNARTAATP
jgi:acyl carrier protein